MNIQHNPAIDLQHVTLCAADSIHPVLAARALDISSAHCQFGEALLFSHEAADTCARQVVIERLHSKADYSRFMLKGLAQHIHTPWALVVQWDGYVVDPSAWRDAFFDYDYIGAPWPYFSDMNVGNGGFSLRSKRLIDALADPRFEVQPGANEDDLICRTYRRALESDFGIRFAPPELARLFAYEYEHPIAPTFGFHSARNMWRHIDDDTMMNLVSTLDDRTFMSSEMIQLLVHYCELAKFDCVRKMGRRYLQHWNGEQFLDRLRSTTIAEPRVQHAFAVLRNTL
jgi:hypothetical protein